MLLDRDVGWAWTRHPRRGEVRMTAAGRRRDVLDMGEDSGPWLVCAACGGAIGVYERCLAVGERQARRDLLAIACQGSARGCAARTAPITAPATRRAPQTPAIPTPAAGNGSRSWSCRSANRRCRWARTRHRGDAGGSPGWDAACLDRTLIVPRAPVDRPGTRRYDTKEIVMMHDIYGGMGAGGWISCR